MKKIIVDILIVISIVIIVTCALALKGPSGLGIIILMFILLEIKRLSNRLSALEDVQNATNNLLIAIKNFFIK